MLMDIEWLLPHIQDAGSPLYHKDFLRTWDHPDTTIRQVLAVAEALEGLHRAGLSSRIFEGGLAVSIFRDQSTRTRFSWASAGSLLGLTLQELDETKSQVAHGETVRETANMISFAAEAVGIRDDMFLGEGHTYMKTFADALDDGAAHGVLPRRPSVINLQCDEDHPTQSLADLQHLRHVFGDLSALRGKRLAMTWAYSPSYGKPLSVPQGILTLMTRFGMDVVLAHPPGYDLIPHTLEVAQRGAEASGGRFTVVNDMDEAFEGADVVYPKSWAPFHVMQERTALLRAGKSPELKALEARCLAQNAEHMGWSCTAEKMARTKGGSALYMHCLPADISGVSCERGEVDAEVFEAYRHKTWAEARNKVYVIAALMLLTRCEHPARVLEALARRATPHRLDAAVTA